MIPGPYSICHITFPDDSDSPTYRTVSLGYDTAGSAFSKREIIAKENSVPVDELVVIRFIDAEESGKFTA